MSSRMQDLQIGDRVYVRDKGEGIVVDIRFIEADKWHLVRVNCWFPSIDQEFAFSMPANHLISRIKASDGQRE